MERPKLLPYSVAVLEKTIISRHLQPPSRAVLKALVEEADSELVTEINEFYTPPDDPESDPVTGDIVANTTLDTYEREILLDLVVAHLLGKGVYWPSNGDDEEYKQRFFNALKEAVQANGWKFV